MNIKKLAPWNWFKKENENNGYAVPVKRGHVIRHGGYAPSPLKTLHEEVDRLFNNVFSGFGTLLFEPGNPFFSNMAGDILKPHLDLGATEKEYTVSVEIPGVEKKDVKLEITNDTLAIRGEKKQENEEKNKHFYRLERSYGSFQRVLSLPDDADRDRVNAVFKKGILTITIPRKALPESNVKQIEINYA
ncbi:MAG: Hsp20/alpha crystallin family protein [Deltaproteobacteria bacterium]|nr:Hsp20/alpha crystallin family protein [Deltaproteobacteria bacterium]